MPRDDDDRLTLNGDEEREHSIDAAVVKELTQHVRWSARALGKIEGYFDQTAKNSEMSQARMQEQVTGLREEQSRELAEVKTTVSELVNRVTRMESTVRELKITDEGLVRECNRRWEESIPVVVQPSESPSTTTPTTPTSWYGMLLMGIFQQPIYLAIAGLIIAMVIIALVLSDDLRALLASFSG